MGLASMLTKVLGKEVDQFSDFYKKNDSFLMNADGTPKTFYHGTKGDFDTFKRGADGATVQKLSGDGYYVTSDPKLASEYATQAGGNVMPLHVRGDKIKQYEKPSSILVKPPKMTPEYIQKLQSEGYEGLAGMRYPSEVIVFNPNQLKSVHNKAPTSHANIMKAIVPGGLAAESVRRAQMQRLEAQDRPLEDQLLGL